MNKASWQAKVAAYVVRRRVKPRLANMRDIASVRAAFGTPLPAPQDSSHGYSDSSVEPQYRGKGKHAGRGNSNHSKGKGNNYFSHPSGKRGRDSLEDNARDVRQKSWNQDGKSIAEAWSKSPHVRLYMRDLSLGTAK